MASRQHSALSTQPRKAVALPRQRGNAASFRIPVRDVAEYPSALGYRMPAEWETHAATWLAWPHNRTDWPGKFEPIPYVYAEIVRHLSRVERVELIVNDEQAELRVREILA